MVIEELYKLTLSLMLLAKKEILMVARNIRYIIKAACQQSEITFHLLFG